MVLNIEDVVAGSCVFISSVGDIAQTLATFNKELVSVDFWKTYGLTAVGIRALSNCRKLEEVDLSWWYVYTHNTDVDRCKMKQGVNPSVPVLSVFQLRDWHSCLSFSLTVFGSCHWPWLY